MASLPLISHHRGPCRLLILTPVRGRPRESCMPEIGTYSLRGGRRPSARARLLRPDWPAERDHDQAWEASANEGCRSAEMKEPKNCEPTALARTKGAGCKRNSSAPAQGEVFSLDIPSPETYPAELWIKQSGFRPLLIGNRVGPLSCVRTGAVGSDNSVRSTLLLCRHTVDRTSTSDRRVGRVDGPWR